MKLWKLVLALALGTGVVLAYLYFPNPLEQAAADVAAEKSAPAEQPAENKAAEAPGGATT